MKKRILFIIAFLTFQLHALNQEGVHHYVKEHIEKKTNSPVANIETLSTYPIQGANGWEVYFLSLDIETKVGRSIKKHSISKIVFTKGNKLAFSLKDKSGQDYKKILKPKVPDEAYDSEHLLVGNRDAKHKILILSDPFCPYCQEITPKLIDDVKANPKTFALYYYHLPLLRIHPASDTATRAMLIFQKRGDIEHLKDMYHLVVNPREINAGVVLKAIKEKTGVQIKRVDIYSSEVNEALAIDKVLKKRLLVTGTPTIFIDGIWDPTRMAYKNYLKK